MIGLIIGVITLVVWVAIVFYSIIGVIALIYAIGNFLKALFYDSWAK